MSQLHLRSLIGFVRSFHVGAQIFLCSGHAGRGCLGWRSGQPNHKLGRVQARLEIDDVWISFEGTTDAGGTLVYDGRDLSPANVKTLIDHLDANGLVWAGHYSTPENKFRM